MLTASLVNKNLHSGTDNPPWNEKAFFLGSLTETFDYNSKWGASATGIRGFINKHCCTNHKRQNLK
jgi:hypothetical protein